MPEFLNNNDMYDDSELIDESVRGFIGVHSRSKQNMEEVREIYNGIAKSFVNNRWIGKPITKSEYKKLDHHYNILKKEFVLYHEYKRSFDFICHFMGIPNNSVILENVVLSKLEDNNSDKPYKCAIKYSKGSRKVIIPNGTVLTHVSPVDDIRELKPAFRSKVRGKYMYPSPRVFFTLSKEIEPTKAGLENMDRLRKYTPKETIQYAYIDPTYSEYDVGSIYVETSMPIPVIKMSDHIKRKFNFLNMRESTTIDDLANEILTERKMLNDFLNQNL